MGPRLWNGKGRLLRAARLPPSWPRSRAAGRRVSALCPGPGRQGWRAQLKPALMKQTAWSGCCGLTCAAGNDGLALMPSWLGSGASMTGCSHCMSHHWAAGTPGTGGHWSVWEGTGTQGAREGGKVCMRGRRMDALTVGLSSPPTAATQGLAEPGAPSWCHGDTQAGAVSGPGSVPLRVGGGSEAHRPLFHFPSPAAASF